MKRFFIWLLSLGMVVVFAFMLRHHIAFFAADLLLRDDHPAAGADGIILLLGGVEERPIYAAELWKKGIAPVIIFGTIRATEPVKMGLIPDETTLTRMVFQKIGLPESSYVVINTHPIHSTYTEAQAVFAYYQQKEKFPQRLVLVTSWPHSSRSAWIFEKIFKETRTKIEVAPMMDIGFEQENWWEEEEGLLFIFEEYVKWGRYLLKY